METFHGRGMNCDHEYGNAFDSFSIKTEKDGLNVGHIPYETSRATKFILDRGAKVTAKITSDHYRKPPLFPGGLEVRPLHYQRQLEDNFLFRSMMVQILHRAEGGDYHVFFSLKT